MKSPYSQFMCNLLSFAIWIPLGKDRHHQDNEHVCHPREFSGVCFLPPAPIPPPDIFSITLYWFRFSRILHKWNQAVYAFDFSVWHLSRIIIILKLIHVAQCPMMSSSTLLSGIPLHGYTSLLICILGLLPVFIITNK